MSASYSLDLIRLQALYKQCDENSNPPLGKTPEELASSVQQNIKAAPPAEILDTQLLAAALKNLEQIGELISSRQLTESSQGSKNIKATIVRIKTLCDATTAKYAPELLKRLESQFDLLPRKLAIEAAATVCQMGDHSVAFRENFLSRIRHMISMAEPFAKNPDYAESIEKISLFAKKYLPSEEAAHFFVTLKSPSGKKASFNSSALTAVSGFFNVMLSGSFQESNQTEIALGDISDNTFDHLALLIRRKERAVMRLSEDSLLALLDKATAFTFSPELIDLCIEAINKRSSLYQLERDSRGGLTLILKSLNDSVRQKLNELLDIHPFLSVLIHGVDLMQVSVINSSDFEYLGEIFPHIPSLSFTIPSGEDNPETLLTDEISPQFSQLTLSWASTPSLSSIESFIAKIREIGNTDAQDTQFRLRLKKAKLLREEALLKIVQLAGPSIRELDLEMARITDETLIGIVNACPNLEALNLKSCTRLTDTGLQVLANNLRKLRFLSLANPGRGKLTDTTLRTILLNNPHLETLDLSWQSNLSGESIKEIPLRLPGLKKLFLTNCNKISDPEVDLIASSCSQLSTLALDFCKQLTKESLHQLFQAKNIHCISIKGLFCDQTKWKDQLAPVLMAREENLSLVISGQSVLPTPADTALLYPAIRLEICST